LDNGPSEIRAIDGLRALAAGSVLAFHASLLSGLDLHAGGISLNFVWEYLRTGVHLFFVISGFLLFMPFARAILAGRPLPSTRNFLRRRALRILPAYWVCVLVLVIAGFSQYLSLTGLFDVLAHLALVHDYFPAFNRAIQGPFWTLAVEAQFYLLLPLLAAALAWVVGRRPSVWRLELGIVGIIAVALLVRELAAIVVSRGTPPGNITLAALNVIAFALTGSQGKFIEAFGVGMLCSVLYLWSKGEVGPASMTGAATRRVAVSPPRWIPGLLALAALISALPLAVRVGQVQDDFIDPCFTCMQPTHIGYIAGPFMVALSYGALVLGILWGGTTIRWIFETSVVRFVGLISYSLYLWHLPLLTALLPLFGGSWYGVLLVIGCAILPVAYLSYQFVERPFLRRRNQSRAA
jgi:peptidoglycan/LPS O-acetylase OafA/YrhL